jgi:hypothetical protein
MSFVELGTQNVTFETAEVIAPAIGLEVGRMLKPGNGPL